MAGHYEVAGKTGFTGVLPFDRCNAAAVGTSEQGLIACGEDTSAAAGTLTALDIFANFTYATGHLQNALDYRNNANGFAISSFTATMTSNGVVTQTVPSTMTTIDLGNISTNIANPGSANQNSIVGVYPFNGMTNVGTGVSISSATPTVL